MFCNLAFDTSGIGGGDGAVGAAGNVVVGGGSRRRLEFTQEHPLVRQPTSQPTIPLMLRASYNTLVF